MHISILAIGRLKRAPEEELTLDYIDRLTKLGRQVGISGVRVREIAESNASTSPQRKQQEAKSIIACLPERASIVVLSEGGDNVTSQKFSKLIKTNLDGGERDLVFLIGGPDGFDEALVNQADSMIAFGKMTWPHRLARVMLAEQIYRAVTILVNHPYHRV